MVFCLTIAVGEAVYPALVKGAVFAGIKVKTKALPPESRARMAEKRIALGGLRV
ncbi:hypothetical protein ACWJKU_16915 [Methylocaldum sp. MU1018]